MDQDNNSAKESEIYQRIKTQLEMTSLKQRLRGLIPPKLYQVFEIKQSSQKSTYVGAQFYFEESQDCTNEILSFLEIFIENFIPDTYENFYINLPIAILDFADLVKNQLPHISEKELNSISEHEINQIIIENFDYEKLSLKLEKYFKNEKEFLIQISGIIMKLMQNEILNDQERSVISTNSQNIHNMDILSQQIQENTLNEFIGDLSLLYPKESMGHDIEFSISSVDQQKDKIQLIQEDKLIENSKKNKKRKNKKKQNNQLQKNEQLLQQQIKNKIEKSTDPQTFQELNTIKQEQTQESIIKNQDQISNTQEIEQMSGLTIRQFQEVLKNKWLKEIVNQKCYFSHEKSTCKCKHDNQCVLKGQLLAFTNLTDEDIQQSLSNFELLSDIQKQIIKDQHHQFKNESNKTNELDKFRHQGFNESDFSTNSVSIRQHGDEKKDSGPYDEIILATDTSADEFEEEQKHNNNYSQQNQQLNCEFDNINNKFQKLRQNSNFKNKEQKNLYLENLILQTYRNEDQLNQKQNEIKSLNLQIQRLNFQNLEICSQIDQEEEKNTKKEKSKIQNILYDILLKYNGQYRKNELDALQLYERNFFFKQLQDSHQILLENQLVSQSMLQMLLEIKEMEKNLTDKDLEIQQQNLEIQEKIIVIQKNKQEIQDLSQDLETQKKCCRLALIKKKKIIEQTENLQKQIENLRQQYQIQDFQSNSLQIQSKSKQTKNQETQTKAQVNNKQNQTKSINFDKISSWIINEEVKMQSKQQQRKIQLSLSQQVEISRKFLGIDKSNFEEIKEIPELTDYINDAFNILDHRYNYVLENHKDIITMF